MDFRRQRASMTAFHFRVDSISNTPASAAAVADSISRWHHCSSIESDHQTPNPNVGINFAYAAG